ncbi:MAG: hypothetical protein K1X85_01615 [Ignavibacteria bacterium]|nr:hypothetical protein [Ignavibacteria bacterium]
MAIFQNMSSNSSYPHSPAPDPSKTQDSFQPLTGKNGQSGHEMFSRILIAAGVILVSVLTAVIILKISE